MNSQIFRAGDILAVRNYSFMGARIRSFTKSQFNHVGMFISPDSIVEATFNGVYLSPLEKFEVSHAKKQLDYSVFRFKDVTQVQINAMCSFVTAQIGRRYDFVQLVSIAAYYMFGVSKRLEPINIREWWICSELVAAAANGTGIRFQQNVDPDMTSAQDIVASEAVFKVV